MGAAELTDRLDGILRHEQLVTDPALKASYEVDWTGRWHHPAALVVRPRTTEEVSEVLRACSETQTPLVPQGGNTGLVGGAVPRSGCDVVLSLGLMKAAGPPDPTDMSVVAEAGATLASVQASAAIAGASFGVDLAARESATVGGMVATNAGGTHFLRYGSMRDQVIGLEAVTADGTVVGAVPGLAKDNTGYHLPSLLCGTEGTLAVVTRVHLRLVPTPPERAASLLGFADTSEALGAVAALRHVPCLSALEFLDSRAMTIVSSHLRSSPPLRQDGGPCLLVEVSGPVGCADELVDSLSALDSAVATAVATEGPGLSRLWRWRDSVPEALAAIGTPHKLDVSLPPGEIVRFETELELLLANLAPEVSAVIFGHAGDGNLHVNLLGLAPEDLRVDSAVLELAARRSGSISAEHGIGVAKRDFLHLTRSPSDVELMRSIKTALDPSGILNPGVLLGS